MGHDCGTKPGSAAAGGGFHVIDGGSRDRNRKIRRAWANYRTAVAALAESDQSDPVLGNPRFVSSERISASLNRLSWFSTTKPVSDCGELPAESVGDRSGRELFLAILRHGNRE